MENQKYQEQMPDVVAIEDPSENVHELLTNAFRSGTLRYDNRSCDDRS